ncbi:ferric-chelate reductase [Cordyceps fumosorosea ARSEF 2679]|uniref:Ferric-chelate reductase n=1 Tax=Cordyceps fumosorosea (strain ARSEF 2679) TaxID=1081104 RepID=A0A167R448_CORFA|nr:ferric-chelate reductase [Cordyceps fumosorosea ARSEF 2679]OAA58254.1 ferric-chelate reductase [Cordyceps fumosorosea ARSEF 2679]
MKAQLASLGLLLLTARRGRCAEEPSFNRTCAESCQSALYPILFTDFVPHRALEEQRCRSNLSLASTYLCVDLYCGAATRRLAWTRENSTCAARFNISLPEFSRFANYTREEISRIARIRRGDALGPQFPRGEPVLPAPEYCVGWFQTLNSGCLALFKPSSLLIRVEAVLIVSPSSVANTSRRRAAVMAFWVLVVAFGFLHRLYLASCRVYYSYPSLQLVPLPPIRASWLKRRLVLPSTFGYRCAQRVWGCSVPPRLQSLTILTFVSINITCSFIGYRITRENYYFDDVVEQGLRYVSDRTGIMAFVNFPLIWLFGMRNNFALWLTGWDFGTYNSFHRWTARVATVQAIVHSVGYTVLLLRQGSWNALYTEYLEPYWLAGVLATIFMSLIIPLSKPSLRRYSYELFLAIHIGFSVLLLFFMLGHVSIFEGRWNGFVRVPTYIWIFDRVMRALRAAAFRPLSWGSQAHALYCPAADIVQLSVRLEWYSLRKPDPGTFFYLTVLSDVQSRLQSHPFTVASVVTTAPASGVGERTALLAPVHDSDETAEIKTDACSTSVDFLIRPYDGFTAQLRELAQEAKSFKVLVEGPYGTSHPLQTYSHVVFIVGGTGIVTPISYLPCLILDPKRNPDVHLHWAVREPAFASMVLDQYLGDAVKSDNISVTLHASRFVNIQPVSSSERGISQLMGRPNAAAIIAAVAASAGQGRLAVVACGPEGLLDDARLGVVRALQAAACTIDYFQDSFAW